MRDRETGTLWQHATGESLIGPLQGARLDLMGGELTTWAGWKEAHPYTLAALEPAEWKGLLSKERTTTILEKATDLASVPGQTPRDRRLPMHEMIVGVVIGDTARAYPLQDLRQVGTVEEVVNGRQIRVEYDGEHDAVQAHADGTQITIKRTRWAGWYEFNPETTIFERNRP